MSDTTAKQPAGTRVQYRTADEQNLRETFPKTNFGTVISWGTKWVTIKNEETGRQNWAYADGGCVPALDRQPAREPAVVRVAPERRVSPHWMLMNLGDAAERLARFKLQAEGVLGDGTTTAMGERASRLADELYYEMVADAAAVRRAELTLQVRISA